MTMAPHGAGGLLYKAFFHTAPPGFHPRGARRATLVHGIPIPQATRRDARRG